MDPFLGIYYFFFWRENWYFKVCESWTQKLTLRKRLTAFGLQDFGPWTLYVFMVKFQISVSLSGKKESPGKLLLCE